MLKLSTFSIAARCPRSGMLGIAVSTAVPAVGDVCAFVAPKTGAVATQSWVNPYFGIDGLAMLRDGASATQTLNRLINADGGKALRQLGIVDHKGGVAAFTGEDCTEWCGHEIGDSFTVQGNMLTGPETISEMARSARETTDLDLPERLMRALEAGQAAGGDMRGKQSAYMRVFDTEEYPYLSLSVDDNPDPVTELRRIFKVAQAQFLPFVAGMPTREDPMRATSDEATAILMKAPADRPVK
ncbi:DUF1028 domain-containing protein [Rhodobacteraceae bacterium F11138]|nr:DUF1028 domain-containing protein [Rhodobacteraceae bacterium F11138]